MIGSYQKAVFKPGDDQWMRDARQLLADVDLKGKFRDVGAWMQEACRLLQVELEFWEQEDGPRSSEKP